MSAPRPHGDPLEGALPDAAGAAGHEAQAGGDTHATTTEQGLTGILDALAEAVQQARAMPMSSSVLVSRAELLDLVAQAREVIPTQLVQADEVLANADAERARARAEAEELLEKARAEAAELVSQESVVHEARAEAERILEEARAEGARLRREADDYCDRRLGDFEIDLGRVLAQVQAGRARLAERLGE